MKLVKTLMLCQKPWLLPITRDSVRHKLSCQQSLRPCRSMWTDTLMKSQNIITSAAGPATRRDLMITYIIERISWNLLILLSDTCMNKYKNSSLRTCSGRSFTGVITHAHHHNHKMQEQTSSQKILVADIISGARDRDGSSSSQPTTWHITKYQICLGCDGTQHKGGHIHSPVYDRVYSCCH